MDIKFNWIGGATFLLTLGDLTLAVDPVLCEKGTVHDYFWFKSTRLEDPVYRDEDLKGVDLWLITHAHEDHLDQKGLTKISKSATIISNSNASKPLTTAGLHPTVLRWGDTQSLDLKGYKLAIEAIPAIHGINPLSAALAGSVNGYYVTIAHGGKQTAIYITGDTVYKKNVIRALGDKPIDIMIPNMGAAKEGSWVMTLTLNAKMLIKMMAILNPKLVIPVHYGAFEHYVEPVEKIKAINDPRIHIVEVGKPTLINNQ